MEPHLKNFFALSLTSARICGSLVSFARTARRSVSWR